MESKKKEYLCHLYETIAEELSISDTMLEKAISSYEAVGGWLGECEPDLDVKIMPQGSINLGTVIRPISDKDDYDIDLVCLLLNGSELSAEEIKKIVGDRLKQHKRYENMLEPEGKRCWTLQYDEFHMDILPSVPRYGYFVEPYETQIRLTHKVSDGVYEDRYSNPYAYRIWFETQMKRVLQEAKHTYSIRNNVEIDEVPTFKVKTPLQKAIQLLKRHRDIMFADDKSGDAPISIIITTLASRAYDNESNLFDALTNILEHMSDYIETDENGKYVISNPVMKEENFADKWNTNPHKVECFNRWIMQAKKDIIDMPMQVVGTVEQSEIIKRAFGENITKRAYNKVGDETREYRKENALYINGLQGGVSTHESANSKIVPEHTFYGR